MSLSVRKSFRISEEEERFFREQCELYGMKDSAYFRFLLGKMKNPSGQEVRPKEDFIAIKELTDEINHIGININQIVRNVNMHHYSEHEKRKLFAMMEEIKKKVAGL
ncbi:MAG: MobC family plasmid mobilization relaxosome protein [Lachnospiraceae bacterium]|nr:MobC family plasmid mobilization relaxosome protein [Lachnospiraceae bacterium]MBP3609697.1 MobC family plasmid mobilization relaxosome protein [Lachnospiraceae bacterium]